MYNIKDLKTNKLQFGSVSEVSLYGSPADVESPAYSHCTVFLCCRTDPSSVMLFALNSFTLPIQSIWGEQQQQQHYRRDILLMWEKKNCKGSHFTSTVVIKTPDQQVP